MAGPVRGHVVLRMLRSVPFRVRSECGSFSGTSDGLSVCCRSEADAGLKTRGATDEILSRICDDPQYENNLLSADFAAGRLFVCNAGGRRCSLREGSDSGVIPPDQIRD